MAAKRLPDADYLRERFTYDPATGVLSWKKRPLADFYSERAWKIWNTRYADGKAGTTVTGRLYVIINYSRYMVHRIIWKIVTGCDPINEIDHKDCDGMNNRWKNLREATRQQNCRNKRVSSDLLLPRGVERLPNGRYRARMHNNGTIHLGVCDTPEQAHEMYCKFAGNLYGEFLNLGRK